MKTVTNGSMYPSISLRSAPWLKIKLKTLLDLFPRCCFFFFFLQKVAHMGKEGSFLLLGRIVQSVWTLTFSTVSAQYFQQTECLSYKLVRKQSTLF